MSVSASTLFDSSGKLTDNAKATNAWVGWEGNLQKVIKTIENHTLWLLPHNSDVGVLCYYDNGKYDFGFGARHSRGSVPLNIVKIPNAAGAFKTYSKASWSQCAPVTAPSGSVTDCYRLGWCITGGSYDGKAITGVQAAHLLANQLMYEALETTWSAIKKLGIADVDTVTDNELAAVADIVYNMGSAYKLGTSSTVTLTTTFKAHQNGKVAKGASANTLTPLRDSVCKAIRAYRLSGGKVAAGLVKRRYADVQMYMNNTSANYDVSGYTGSAMNADLVASGASELPAYEGGTDETMATADAVMSVMGGANKNPELLLAIRTGNAKKILAATVVAEKQRAKDKIEEKNKITNGNPKYQTYTTKNDSLFLPNVNLVTDSRAIAGLQLPDHMIYDEATTTDTIKKDNTFDERSKYNKYNFLGRFKKYDHVTDDDLGQAKKTKFFMTRPDMCLYQNRNAKNRTSDKNYLTPSLQCHDPNLIDHLIVDRDLYIYLDRHIQPFYLDTNIAFIPSYTNQFRSTNLPEVNFALAKSSQNLQGVSVSTPSYDSTDTAEATISVNFNMDDHMSILKYNDLIFKYAKSIKEKQTIAYPESIKYNVLDFSTTMFMFALGQDGVTIESYYRSVGVIPMNNPITTIPLNAQAEKLDLVTINFKPNATIDSRKQEIITHFNFLNKIGCTDIKGWKVLGGLSTYDSAINWFMNNYNILEGWLLDNMAASDWYCERYQIYLDMDNNRNVYKLVPIPTVSRMQALMAFLLNPDKDHAAASANFKKHIGKDHADSLRKQVLIKNSSVYKKYAVDKNYAMKTAANSDFMHNGSMKYLQLHLDTATNNSIAKARKTGTFHMNPVGGTRSFGDVTQGNIEMASSLFNIFSTDAFKNGQSMYDIVTRNESYKHLRSFMEANSILWKTLPVNANGDEIGNMNGLLVTNYVFLNMLYNYNVLSSTYIKDIYDSSFSKKGLYLKNGKEDDIQNKLIKSTVNHDAIYYTSKDSKNEGHIHIKSTDSLQDYNKNIANKDMKDIVYQNSTDLKYVYNIREVAPEKRPMYRIAPRGLFLVEDPSTESNHGNVEDELEAAVHNSYALSRPTPEIQPYVETMYALLNKYADSFSYKDYIAGSGMQVTLDNVADTVKKYWDLTRNTSQDGKTITYRKDNSDKVTILDPSKWYINLKSSGRLYKYGLGKMPYLGIIQKNDSSSGDASYTVDATTTLAKIVMSDKDMWDKASQGSSTGDFLVRQAKTGIPMTADSYNDRLTDPEKATTAIPQLDADSMDSDMRMSYMSFLDGTSQAQVSYGMNWLYFYLRNDSNNGKMTTAIDTSIYGNVDLKYKLYMGTYFEAFKTTDDSNHDNVAYYTSEGLKDFNIGSTEVSRSRDASISQIEPNYASDYPFFSGVNSPTSIAKYKYLMPANVVSGDSLGKLSIKQYLKTVVADQIKETALSTARAWFYQNVENIIFTTMSKYFTKGKDIKNQGASGLTIEALDYARFTKDMRSDYTFTVDSYVEPADTSSRLMSIDSYVEKDTSKKTIQVPDFAQEKVVTSPYTFSEMTYIQPNTTSTEIIFGYKEKESKSSIQIEPIKVTDTSVKALDLITMSAFDTIDKTLATLQEQANSSVTNILMNALKSF